jgi:hypothetical protein
MSVEERGVCYVSILDPQTSSLFPVKIDNNSGGASVVVAY